MHVTELIRHRTHTSRVLTRTGLGMHSLAASDGGQGRTVLLDNTGQVGLVLRSVRVLQSRVQNAANGLWH